jgi:hypothetical protein
MKIDYQAISRENRELYGTAVDRYAPTLLANLYDDRTHFVFELLQNAEDAIRKCASPRSRAVHFKLQRDGLKVSHFGKPFDEDDVRGICGINDSTKEGDLTAIGRFGIGFKSVYAITKRPEVHSAGQHFAIESFVHPVEIPSAPQEAEQTVFWFPFKTDDETAFEEIADGLRRLDMGAIRFLRNVEEVSWQIEDGAEGNYCRESRELQPGLRRVTLIGTITTTETLTEEEWLVFSRPVFYNQQHIGYVEIAYPIDPAASAGELRLGRITDSRLSAFFPTRIPTNLGIQLQGPYRTTPARDNVPMKDPWNQYLIKETASLLVESLEVLKVQNILTVIVLRSLPLDESYFGAGTRFRPLYDAVVEAFRTKELLPAAKAGLWLKSTGSALSRGALALIKSSQLTKLFSPNNPLYWLNTNITANRTPELRNFLMKVLDVREVSPEDVIGKLDQNFLKAQTDDWIRGLYELLLGQPALTKTSSFASKPWIRLEDGSHVTAFTSGQPNAFLPSNIPTDFPTVRASVCASEESLKFLRNNLGLSEPDPVDDVIANILPHYAKASHDHNQERYREHLRAIVAAYATPLSPQKDKLVGALRTKFWVAAIDNQGRQAWLQPTLCYLPTERLKQLFEGIPGIVFTNDSIPELRGEAMRDVLIASGASRYLRNIAPGVALTNQERESLRGGMSNTGTEREEDRTLDGLLAILELIGKQPVDEASRRARLLWEALSDVIDRSSGMVWATYHWYYYTDRSVNYDAYFIRVLKAAAWIPTSQGRLATPGEVVFEEIQPFWKSNPVLQAALKFLPSQVNQLAQAVGLNLGMINLLKKSGITSEEELMQRLGMKEDSELSAPDSQSDQKDSHTDTGQGVGEQTGSSSSGGGGAIARGGEREREPRRESAGTRYTFISYLAAQPLDEEEEDVSDSETYQERMRVEDIAIGHILTLEPELQRTPTGNHGFDLFGVDNQGQTNRWIEVKSMTGSLENHPVGMSKRQFEEAQKRGEQYWLYIVEHATSDEPGILKIHNPAGSARTFTFDQGWREIAYASQVNLQTGEIIT